MDSHRYTIYVDAETKQLIEDAAARNNLSVNGYLFKAVLRQLVEDGVMTLEQAERRKVYSDLLQEIYQLRAAIAASRDGTTIDMISAIIGESVKSNV